MDHVLRYIFKRPVLAPFVHRAEWEKRAKQYLHEG